MVTHTVPEYIEQQNTKVERVYVAYFVYNVVCISFKELYFVIRICN